VESVAQEHIRFDLERIAIERSFAFVLEFAAIAIKLTTDLSGA
jgi:hypothetical protein